ncbi:hypothetical protein C8F01DRAFT_1251785 [Mycena amicta]|nr:hypothetical protein C8F01DRAFT_1251785 [Mycena amicta]
MSNTSGSSDFSRQLAAMEARIRELESSVASLSMNRSQQSPPGRSVDNSQSPPVQAPVRNIAGPVTRPGPRIIPLPTASATVSASSEHDDSSVIIIPDSDSEDEAPPVPPPSEPAPSSDPAPEPAPPVSSPARREYVYSSPTVPPTHTTQWSEAAHATQGVPNGHVRLVAQEAAPRKKAVCWVVFRGRTNGVFNSWSSVEDATRGFRFAVYQGYSVVADARRAYGYATAKGYTSTDPPQGGLPLPLAQIPASILDATNRIIDDSRLVPRTTDDPWYIVYQGVNPGIYPTYLEVALNTNGIPLSSHDSRPTLPEAIEAFRDAQSRGIVLERRDPKRRS